MTVVKGLELSPRQLSVLKLMNKPGVVARLEKGALASGTSPVTSVRWRLPNGNLGTKTLISLMIEGCIDVDRRMPMKVLARISDHGRQVLAAQFTKEGVCTSTV